MTGEPPRSSVSDRSGRVSPPGEQPDGQHHLLHGDREDQRAIARGDKDALLEAMVDSGVAEIPSSKAPDHIDRVLGILRYGSCSVELSHHALHLLGSRMLGFSRDLFDDSPANRADAATLASQFQGWADTLPHVVELGLAASHGGSLGGCDDYAEFDFALDVILDGLERARLSSQGSDQNGADRQA